MHSSAIIALLIVSLDAMGLGLIMPVLPTLLRELVPAEQVAGHYGALLSLYALMQVIFAPVLASGFLTASRETGLAFPAALLPA